MEKNINMEELRSVDVATVDADSLVDINTIYIDSNLGKEQKLMEFIRQIKNPFCFICNGMIIKTSFSNTTTDTLEDKLEKLFLSL